MLPPEIVQAAYLVTCHVEGCDNAELTIELNATAESPSVYCGPCGNPITDVEAVSS